MDLNKEIATTAQKIDTTLEKSDLDTARDNLIKSLNEIDPKVLLTKVPSLSKSEKVLLLDALETMSKAKEMDANYTAKPIQGKVYQDTTIQEDVANDDADEKLVKPENAEHNHQGDQTPKGREENKVEDPEKDVKKGYLNSMDMNDNMRKAVAKFREEGKSKSFVKGYGLAKGYSDTPDFEKAIDAEYGEVEAEKSREEVKKGDSVKPTPNPEESQVKDDLEKLAKQPTRGKKSNPKELALGADNTTAQSKVDDLNQGGLKKSVEWGDDNALLKANTGGRNHHFSVNGFYDEALHTVMAIDLTKKLKKSKDTSINGLLEQNLDVSMDEALLKSALTKLGDYKDETKANLQKSFTLEDMADALNLTAKEQSAILGD